MRILKKIATCLALAGASIVTTAQNNDAANGQHQLLNMAPDKGEGKMNPDPRAAWFPRAGLGLFIHWGAIAGYGGGDLSWCMIANKSWPSDGTVTPNFYYGLMDKWNPKEWNPDALLKQAKAAGFQYAVFVTKHHDGYTMWPSKYGDLGTQTKMNNRDFVRSFVDACRKYGLKVGLYYSPPDWWFDRLYRNWSSDKTVLDMNHEPLKTRPVKPADHDKKRVEMVASQVRELLTNYGKIDMLFFDGGGGEITNDEIRKIQPGIVINRRNKAPGDYGDSEGALPGKRFTGWFETNDPVWPDKRWSYSTSDIYNDASTVLGNLVKLRAWGGNYLANIGPEGSGHIPAPATEAMKEMAAWMLHSKESVIDVTGGNYPEASTVPVTARGNNILYAFAMPAYQGYIKIETTGEPKKVTLLRTGQTLSFKREGGKIIISLPPQWRTRMPDAMKIVF
ncbi:alpha-L-fucosidase [Niabella hirudinis]|uniref:alpha-L-fucosidase n=1 Tax=Niabella hirudinis TaxID=1285929 RepID=UPI003EBEAD91